MATLFGARPPSPSSEAFDPGARRPYEYRPGGRGNRPVTDYGSTLVHWMRNRKPRYKGVMQGELERPSASYIIDVRLCTPQSCTDFSLASRCYHRWQELKNLQTQFLSGIYILL